MSDLLRHSLAHRPASTAPQTLNIPRHLLPPPPPHQQQQQHPGSYAQSAYHHGAGAAAYAPGPPPPQSSMPMSNEPTHRYVARPKSDIDRSQIKYSLSMRQEPKRARISGSGPQVDRRLVDPPPIICLKLSLNDPPGLETLDARQLEIFRAAKWRKEQNLLHASNYFCRAALCRVDSEEELRLMEDTGTPYLSGSLVSSIYHLRDPTDQSYASFFVFNDLNCHYEGTFRFRFFLYEWLDTQVILCESLVSKEFKVYSAKRFPGLDVSTNLSRSFQEQGLKIRVRRPTAKKGRASTNSDDQGASRSPPSRRPSQDDHNIGAAGSDEDAEGNTDDEMHPPSRPAKRSRGSASTSPVTAKKPRALPGSSGSKSPPKIKLKLGPAPGGSRSRGGGKGSNLPPVPGLVPDYPSNSSTSYTKRATRVPTSDLQRGARRVDYAEVETTPEDLDAEGEQDVDEDDEGGRRSSLNMLLNTRSRDAKLPHSGRGGPRRDAADMMVGEEDDVDEDAEGEMVEE